MTLTSNYNGVSSSDDSVGCDTDLVSVVEIVVMATKLAPAMRLVMVAGLATTVVLVCHEFGTCSTVGGSN